LSAEGARGQGTAEPWTIARLLRWAADDFRARGFDSPRLDAELLLAEAVGSDRVRLILDSQRELQPEELARFRSYIKRRRVGEPIAYILGRREFHGLTFRVDRRVLVPRPDTETLVGVALERTRKAFMFGRMLDLCTGSGCVAIAFAKQRPTWRITALDASADAITLAVENSVRLGAVFSICFGVGDLTAPLRPEQRFELVTANPPYIPSAELSTLDKGITQFEPRAALDGGSDGLEIVRRIVSEAVPRLEPKGLLALEVHWDQAARVAELLEAAGLAQIERQRDYGGHERVVSGCRP
jgi:release factor glutamine methyltransferase